jgi:hypothetical protein
VPSPSEPASELSPSPQLPSQASDTVHHQPVQHESLAFIVGPRGQDSRMHRGPSSTWASEAEAGSNGFHSSCSKPHLLHFRGEHLHCMALRISWYTTEPLMQCRGTSMGSVRVGEQQEHWSCTSSVSMEYTALLSHLPCNTADRGGASPQH